MQPRRLQEPDFGAVAHGRVISTSFAPYSAEEGLLEPVQSCDGYGKPRFSTALERPEGVSSTESGRAGSEIFIRRTSM